MLITSVSFRNIQILPLYQWWAQATIPNFLRLGLQTNKCSLCCWPSVTSQKRIFWQGYYPGIVEKFWQDKCFEIGCKPILKLANAPSEIAYSLLLTPGLVEEVKGKKNLELDYCSSSYTNFYARSHTVSILRMQSNYSWASPLQYPNQKHLLTVLSPMSYAPC